MIPFSSLLLRNYYNAIGWNEDNSYSQLTRSSTDFELPKSLVLQLANSPTPVFFTSYSLDALPQLNGSLSYVTTSQALSEIQPVNNIAFKHVVDRFRVLPPPHRPYPKDEIWLRGRRIEGRDYLLYSRMHFPSLHLSGLATTRLAPTLQLHLAFLSLPNPPSARPTSPSNASHSRAPSGGDNNAASQVSSPPTPSNLLISLQHDTGKYAGEYTYSVQDGMFGWRGLYNFGWKDTLRELPEVARPLAGIGTSAAVVQQAGAAETAIVQDVQEAGQKGRFSAGAEVYFSAKQRSFGISTGMRYQTIPATSTNTSPSSLAAPHQAPTALTILYNPLIGFVSTAYSAQVHPHIALSTRFGVNVYSYESDLTVGGEWWIGRRRGKRENAAASTPCTSILPVQSARPQIEDKVEKTEVRVGEEPAFGSTRAEAVEGEVDGPFAEDRIYPRTPVSTETSIVQKAFSNTASPVSAGDERKDDDEREGVLKARVSGNWVSLPSDPAASLLVAGLHLVEMNAGHSFSFSADVASQYPYYTKRVYETAWSQ